MFRDSLVNILTDAGGTLLAALVAIIATAWWKAIRLSLQLRQLANLVRSIRDKTYPGFTSASDKELRTEAESKLSALEADIEKSAEGLFKLSRHFRFQIDAMKKDLMVMQEKGQSAAIAKLISRDPVSEAYPKAVLAFEAKARNLACKAWKRFWLYLLP